MILFGGGVGRGGAFNLSMNGLVAYRHSEKR